MSWVFFLQVKTSVFYFQIMYFYLKFNFAFSESITIKATSRSFFMIIFFAQAVIIPQIKHKKHLADKFNYISVKIIQSIKLSFSFVAVNLVDSILI